GQDRVPGGRASGVQGVAFGVLARAGRRVGGGAAAPSDRRAGRRVAPAVVRRQRRRLRDAKEDDPERVAWRGPLARGRGGGTRRSGRRRVGASRAAGLVGIRGDRPGGRRSGGATVKVVAPAKINLYLWVGPRRGDELHEIESVMQSVSLL